MKKHFMVCSILLFLSICHAAVAKDKRNNVSRTLIQRAPEQRVYGASLWIDNIKMPITSGKVIWIDSVFVLFKGKKSLSTNDAHASVVLQIHDSKGVGVRAAIVDYDIPTGWMLGEVKSSLSSPKPKLQDTQIVDLAWQNEMIDFKEKKDLSLALQKFEKNRHERGIAGEKNFHQILAQQMKDYSQRLTDILVKSQRKIFWKDNISMPLPLVDSCEVDTDFLVKTKDNAQLKVEQAFKCEVQGAQSQRSIASTLKPEYTVFTGVMHSEEPFLKVPSVSAQLSSLSLQMDDETALAMGSVGRCVSHWIAEKQLYMKSCVEKNKSFQDIYNGFHLIGFYHNQKVIYKLLKVKGFSKDSQIQIVDKMLNTTRGSVL